MYHRFTSEAKLAEQCEHLRRHYSPISLDRIAELLATGEPFPSQALGITVDDGYQDFADIAYPVFSRYEIPAIVFLVSEFSDQRLWLWWDRMEYAFLNSPRKSLSCTLPDGQSFSFRLGGREERLEAVHTLAAACVHLPHQTRCSFVDAVPKLLDVDVPFRAPAQYAAMTWDTVRNLAKGGLATFGAHTRTHPILSRLPDTTSVEDEILGSRRHVERELGREIRHFCYPNGKEEDIGEVSLRVMEQNGFQTAVTAESGVNVPASHPFRLRRIAVDDHMDLPRFTRSAAAFRAGPAVLR